MARLNEPVAPAVETLDSLKRKFLRQNRDITKQNASQSIRIRALENELSKALSQNLELREALNHAERIAESSKDIKMQLQNRMQEISALISGIGEVSPSSRKSQDAENTRSSPSPDQKNWKNRCTMSDAVNGQDGRLPAILENKHYPRKTLEREEILAIVNTETEIDDSPEIGPLPVSQFVDEDPVKIDLPVRARNEDSEEPASLDPAFSANLEQRRKRKDSIIPSEMTNSQQTEEPRASRDNAGTMRTGAKRKLSVREDEESAKSRTSLPDDFKFTRITSEEKPRKTRPHLPTHNSTRKTLRDSENTNNATKDEMSAPTTTASRKILAPKSVNDSPKKMSRASSGDTKPGKVESIKPNYTKDRCREKKQEPVSIFEVAEPMLDTIEVQAEPETPAPLKILSPLSSLPSDFPVLSRDTPPPAELGVENEGLRPSRRARGAVSYAEPNLRDKMRRPTKDLIDAVGSHGKPQKEVDIKVEENATVIFHAPMESLIKPEAEAEEDDAWKSMPVATSTTVENSPLSSKMTAPDLLPSSITTHRRRRESLLNQIDMDSARPGSATAISNLLAETRKVKAAAVRDQATKNESERARQNDQPDIYEFKGSPPAPDEKTIRPSKIDRAAPPKYVRRPVIRDSRRSSSSSLTEDGEASDMDIAKRAEVHRRQTGLGLRSSSVGSFRQGDQESGRPLKRSTSTTAVSGTAGDGAAPRNDRISARRRSMML